MSNGLDLFGRNKRLSIVGLNDNSPDCISRFIKKYPQFLKGNDE